jgi:hypothetical protein
LRGKERFTGLVEQDGRYSAQKTAGCCGTQQGFYLRHRPHQGLDNKPLDGCEPEDDAPPLTSIRCQSWLGGSLKSYSRKAA